MDTTYELVLNREDEKLSSVFELALFCQLLMSACLRSLMMTLDVKDNTFDGFPCTLRLSTTFHELDMIVNDCVLLIVAGCIYQ